MAIDVEQHTPERAGGQWMVVPITFGVVLALLFGFFLYKSFSAPPRSSPRPEASSSISRASAVHKEAESSTEPASTSHTVTYAKPTRTSSSKRTKAATTKPKKTTMPAKTRTSASRLASKTTQTTHPAISFDNRSAYETALRLLDTEYAQKEEALENAYQDLQMEREIKLQILREQYAGVGQLESGAYQRKRETILEQYRKLENENRQALALLYPEWDAARQRLKQQYKIPE